MPFVMGYLRRARRPGRPDQGLPDIEGPVDPDYGIDEGMLPGWPEAPEVDPPEPPPGIWPPLTPEHPWRPLPSLPDRPSQGLPPTRPPAQPGQPPMPGQPLPGEPPVVGGGPVLPPGAIWPPLPPDVHGKYLALVLIGGMPGGVKYRYVVIDADAKPPHRPGHRPDQGLPGEPAPEPHR